ncbi:MAG: peptidase [Bdellovibrio sp. ArHS]|uniref:aminotransferase class IV n=1 Tax=Bdellovibrio sp. ArHS TaxID=1569284 RepID=UPI000582E615|nr:aminotransferase class IV [Bdellovibrio sp. ArHS]KHD90075.1 MAG: peptidase [Bdellovibrio sp. ArHS]
MSVAVLSPSEIQAKLQERSYAAQKTYLAMYSTWLGGITTEPALMMVPIDDHLVHRGDGVFEAIKVVDGKAFLMQEHLERLELSAAKIGLQLPMPLDEMREVIFQTVQVAATKNAVLRLYISRGPGGFTTNPYECVSSQMYLVVTAYTPYPDERYINGVRAGRSQIPPKDPWFATIKTCNYLQNVLMKKESVDRKLDFTIGVDSQGYLTESSTENIVMIDKNRTLVRPRLRQILKGTTMMRTFELAQGLLSAGALTGIQEKDLTEMDLYEAQEVMMIGTTLDVLPVTEYEGKKIGTGKQGPVSAQLLKLLRDDMKQGPKSTPVAL